MGTPVKFPRMVEYFAWEDYDIGLLLCVIEDYMAENLMAGVQWENIKTKYDDITRRFIDRYENGDAVEKGFNKVRVTAKIKHLRVKVRKALASGDKGACGKTVALFFDRCSRIWSVSEQCMERSLESSDLSNVEGISTFQSSSCSNVSEMLAMQGKEDIEDPFEPHTVNHSRIRSEFAWESYDINLLLCIMEEYKAENSMRGVEWETVKTKYGDIASMFNDRYLHGQAVDRGFNKGRVAAKIKWLRHRYKKAVENRNEHAGGKTVYSFFDKCSKVFGGSHFLQDIADVVESSDVELASLDPSSPPQPQPVAPVEQISEKRINWSNRVSFKRRLAWKNKKKLFDNRRTDLLRHDLKLTRAMLKHFQESGQKQLEETRKLTETAKELGNIIKEGFSALTSCIATEKRNQSPPTETKARLNNTDINGTQVVQMQQIADNTKELGNIIKEGMIALGNSINAGKTACDKSA